MSNENFEWKEIINSNEWDEILASLQGHPLQSAKWGDARKINELIKDIRWAVFKNGEPIYLVRFETRLFLGFLKIAWVPRGPTELYSNYSLILKEEFLQRLKKIGFYFCIMSPWRETVELKHSNQRTQTIWIDLTLGKEKLFQNFSSSLRNDIRNAKRKNLFVEISKKPEDIALFYGLCKKVSLGKRFPLHTSENTVQRLILENTGNKSVESHLFIARHEGKFCGGLLIIRCGLTVHNWLTAYDREFAKLNIGATLHWEVAQWGAAQNCKLYDLEGIDTKNNQNVYNFKRKMKGKIISLPELELYPLNLLAKIGTKCLNINNGLSSFFKNIKIWKFNKRVIVK